MFIFLSITFCLPWILYFYFTTPINYFPFIAFVSLAFLSNNLAEKLIYQSQMTPEIELFLIDPNAFVYCFVWLFFNCSFFFSIIFFSFMAYPFITSFFYEGSSYSARFLLVITILLFIDSFIIIDQDISNTFKFKASSDSSNTVQNNVTWEFSLYFFQFFGLFFDFFLVFLFLYLVVIFYIINCNYFYNKPPTLQYNIDIFAWSIRSCTFFISIYFYSGEYFLYDSGTFFVFFIWLELFLIVVSFIFNINQNKRL